MKIWWCKIKHHKVSLEMPLSSTWDCQGPDFLHDDWMARSVQRRLESAETYSDEFNFPRVKVVGVLFWGASTFWIHQGTLTLGKIGTSQSWREASFLVRVKKTPLKGSRTVCIHPMVFFSMVFFPHVTKYRNRCDDQWLLMLPQPLGRFSHTSTWKSIAPCHLGSFDKYTVRGASPWLAAVVVVVVSHLTLIWQMHVWWA